MIFFVTCGRGFENFVREELESMENVCATYPIGEGKIAFCQCFQDTLAQNYIDPICNRNVSNTSCLANKSIIDTGSYCLDNFFSLKNLDKVFLLLKLKLVEKLYILLYYKNIKHIELDKNCTDKHHEELLKINYMNVMEVVTQVGELKQNISMPWKQCYDPDKCFAFTSRHQEKDIYLKQKRKFSIEETCSVTPEISKCGKKYEKYDSSSVDIDVKEAYASNSIQNKTFRVSCRIRGKCKQMFKSFLLSKSMSENIITTNTDWTNVNGKPDLDIYANLNDDCILVGASLTDKPLSLRPYISHITLRSTICHLMIKLAQISEGEIVLDPMCGAGTILLEATCNIEKLRIIANDNDPRQLNAAQCNLSGLKNVEYILSDAKSLPLQDNCIDALVCDFPFGKKYAVVSSQTLLLQVLKECVRVLQKNSRLVMLVSNEQQFLLKEICHEISELKSLGHYPVSLGLTQAFLFTFQVKK